jgi:hypothetical protein
MTAAGAEASVPALRKTPFRPWPLLSILSAALMMVWPSIYNGFPILYADSMTYIADGWPVARALFLHHYSSYYGMRSFIYSLGILPLHWNLTPWPIVFAQALLTSWVLWLLVRTFTARNKELYFLLIAGMLAALTTVSWYVSLIMPDILGPLMYLAIYLIVFARNSLRPLERWTLLVLTGFSAASHITHLLLAAGLWILLAVLVLLRKHARIERLQSQAYIAAALLISSCATLALHDFLYGKPSLNGERPPYLMARIIADGPGRTYLEQNCPKAHFLICRSVVNLPQNADDFLWQSGGVWDTATPEEQQQILKEEMPFVLATIRAYPHQQLLKSMQNIESQLLIFGIEDFDASNWVLGQFESTMPGQQNSYFNSRQQRNALPVDDVTTMVNWFVLISLIILAVLAPFAFWRGNSQLAWLTVVVASTTLANALLSGALSMVDDRYQARIIWLVPLLAALFLSDFIQNTQAFLHNRSIKRTSKPNQIHAALK